MKTDPRPYSDHNDELVHLRHMVPDLIAALERHGRHDYGCASSRYQPGLTHTGIPQPCDCGYAAALRNARALCDH